MTCSKWPPANEKDTNHNKYSIRTPNYQDWHSGAKAIASPPSVFLAVGREVICIDIGCGDLMSLRPSIGPAIEVVIAHRSRSTQCANHAHDTVEAVRRVHRLAVESE